MKLSGVADAVPNHTVVAVATRAERLRDVAPAVSLVKRDAHIHTHTKKAEMIDENLWNKEHISKYGWHLRLWIVRQILCFREHTPKYDADVLRYKTARFLLRDVRPQERTDRGSLADFYRWVTALVELVAVSPLPNEWQQHVCCYRGKIESDRYELEEYGEPDSTDEYW